LIKSSLFPYETGYFVIPSSFHPPFAASSAHRLRMQGIPMMI